MGQIQEKTERRGGEGLERAHALLGASSAHRWLECTPSAVAESEVEDGGSDFAREGSLAHAMAARALKEELGQDTSKEDIEIEELWDGYHSGEMDEYVEGYVNFVRSLWRESQERQKEGSTCGIRIEQKLYFDEWVPGGFGTGDAVIVGDGFLRIIDLKYGKGVAVSAENNPQLKLYAAGAAAFYDTDFQIEEVELVIYQPRIGNVSMWRTTLGEIHDWCYRTVKGLALTAYNGGGWRRSGDWCRFCKVKGTCGALATAALLTWEEHPWGDCIGKEELGRILPKLPLMKDWMKTVEESSLKMALAGDRIPGFKIVEGRSVRKITSQENAGRALAEAGYTDEEIWRPREIRTLTDLEKTVGKKHLAEVLADWIEKPRGKPTLVEESDKRKAIEPGDEFERLDIRD